MEIHVHVKTSHEGLLIAYIEGILANGTELVFDWEKSSYEETNAGFTATLQNVTINGIFPVNMPEGIDSLVITSIQFSDGSSDGITFPAVVEKVVIQLGTDGLPLMVLYITAAPCWLK